MDKIVYLTPDFAVASQLTAEDFAEIAKRGFKVVTNNRPDHEEQGQLSSRCAAAQARLVGLEYRFNPASKLDVLNDEVIDAADRLLVEVEGPILAYCRTGSRSSIIWAAAASRRLPVDDVLARLADAGIDLAFLRDEFEAQSGRPAVTTDAPMSGGEAARDAA